MEKAIRERRGETIDDKSMGDKNKEDEGDDGNGDDVENGNDTFDEDHSYNPELVDKGLVEWLERIMLLGFDPDDKVGAWETSEFDESKYNDEVSADDKGGLIG